MPAADAGGVTGCRPMWSAIEPNPRNVRTWQVAVLVAPFAFWRAMTAPGLIPPVFFENDRQAAFIFGEPPTILGRIWNWFVVERGIYGHLWVTLLETVLAFVVGTATGLAVGTWLAPPPVAARTLDPYIRAAHSMPRVISAPIFALWFGLGIASKVAPGFALVFFIADQGVKEAGPTALAGARMPGASAAPVAARRLAAERHQLGILVAAQLGRPRLRRRGGRRVTRARRAASATRSCRRKARSTSTRRWRASWCSRPSRCSSTGSWDWPCAG